MVEMPRHNRRQSRSAREELEPLTPGLVPQVPPGGGRAVGAPWPTADGTAPQKAPRWHDPTWLSRASFFSAFYQSSLMSGLMLFFEAWLLIGLHRSYAHNRLNNRLLGAVACCSAFPGVVYVTNEFENVKARIVGRVLCLLLAAVAFSLLVHSADESFSTAEDCANRNEAASKAGANATSLIGASDGCGLDSALQATEQGVYSLVVACTCALAVLSSAVLVFFARRRVGDFLVVAIGGAATAGSVTVVAMRKRMVQWRLAVLHHHVKHMEPTATDSPTQGAVEEDEGNMAASQTMSDREGARDDAAVAERSPRANRNLGLTGSAEIAAGSVDVQVDYDDVELTFEDREALRDAARETRQRRIRAAAKWSIAVVLLMSLLGLIGVVSVPQAQNDEGLSPSAEQRSASIVGCNGNLANCNRRVDEIVWLTTHNSMSALADDFVGPNQYFGMNTQLSDGVRAFMIDIHNTTDPVTGNVTAALCHGDCRVGSLSLNKTLSDFRVFLDAHPTDVVVFLLEQYSPDALVVDAVMSAGLGPKLWHVNDTPASIYENFAWPTLAEMTASGKQVLWFSDVRGGSTIARGSATTRSTEWPWMHFMWDFFFETSFEVNTTAGFNCERDVRGQPYAQFDGRLAILNHFLTDLVGAPYLAAQANPASVINRHFFGCRGQWGTVPQFIAVDFYSIAETLATAATLNMAI